MLISVHFDEYIEFLNLNLSIFVLNMTHELMTVGVNLVLNKYLIIFNPIIICKYIYIFLNLNYIINYISIYILTTIHNITYYYYLLHNCLLFTNFYE